jgi:hypothetical protein
MHQEVGKFGLQVVARLDSMHRECGASQIGRPGQWRAQGSRSRYVEQPDKTLHLAAGRK